MNFHYNGGEFESKNIKNWETTSGGGMWCAGVGGPATGKGYLLGIIDDPIKDAVEAQSVRTREGLKDWHQSVWTTREEGWSDDNQSGAQIIIQTRWHEDDLAGYLLSEEEAASRGEGEPEHWHIFSFEALKEAQVQRFPKSCTVYQDWRRPGEALWPEKRSSEYLNRIKKRWNSNIWWQSLYQQRPAAEDGQFIKWDWFEVVDAEQVPVFTQFYRAYDFAFTAQGGDYTASIKGAVDRYRNLWIWPDTLVQTEAPDVRNLVIRKTRQDPKKTYVQIEKAHAGLSIFQDLTRMEEMADVPLFGYVVQGKGDKLARAAGWISLAQRGKIKIVSSGTQETQWRDPMVEAFRKQIVGFRNLDGDVDDFIDAMTILYNLICRVNSDFGLDAEIIIPGSRAYYKKLADANRYGMSFRQ